MGLILANRPQRDPLPHFIAVAPSPQSQRSMARRLAPTKVDAGIVASATLLPFLMGAAPESGSDLGAVISTAIYAAAAGLGGLVGKGVVVFFASVGRRWSKRALADDKPGNDVLAGAVGDTADRLDPDGKRE